MGELDSRRQANRSVSSVAVGRLEIRRAVEDDGPIFSPWESFLGAREADRSTPILPAYFRPCRLRRAGAGFRFVFDRSCEGAP